MKKELGVAVTLDAKGVAVCCREGGLGLGFCGCLLVALCSHRAFGPLERTHCFSHHVRGKWGT